MMYQVTARRRHRLLPEAAGRIRRCPSDGLLQAAGLCWSPCTNTVLIWLGLYQPQIARASVRGNIKQGTLL